MKVRFADDAAVAYGSPRASAFDSLGAILSRAIALPRMWLRRAHERRALSQLDAYLLRDIGLDRKQVEEMAARPFWRA